MQSKLDALFKPATGGYVFRAPNPRIVAQAKHYFATEDQKTQILQAMKMPSCVVEVFWLTFFALCVGGGTTLPFFVGDPEPTKTNVAIIVVMAILGLSLPLPLIGYWQLHQLKPILQTLRQTNERISFREINAGLRKTTSAEEYARNCILSGFAFGITLFNAGFSRGYAAFLFWSAVAILLGFAMVRQGLLAMRKASES